MRNNNIVVYDGRKAVGIWDEIGWTELTGQGAVRDGSASQYASALGWMYRCMSIYANAIASIPLDLLGPSGDVVDSTDDWENVLGFLSSPEPLIWLIAAAQGLSGKAYLYQSKNSYTVVKTLRPLAPSTIRWDENKKIFTRDVNPPKDYPPTIDADGNVSKEKETIAYIWMPDPDVEWGPPLKWPGQAACAAAGVSYNMDRAVDGFFKRGMLHVTAFSVPPGTQPADKERFEEKVQRIASGVRNAFKTIFLEAGKVDAVDLGGGLEQLANQTLTQEKREDMAAAWGIPLTKLLSTDASGLGGGGVSKSDDMRLYNDTALPALVNILRELNRQIFKPLGYTLVECHERMEIYQTSETERVTAFSQYVDTFSKNPALALIIAPMLGIVIPDDVLSNLQKFIEEDKPKQVPPQLVPFSGQNNQPAPTDANAAGDEIASELMKWAAYEKKHEGKGRAFECKHIPARLQMHIRSLLKAGGDVDTIFMQAGTDVPALVLAQAINGLQKEG
jgi:hypothetical protein